MEIPIPAQDRVSLLLVEDLAPSHSDELLYTLLESTTSPRGSINNGRVYSYHRSQTN